VYRLKLSCKVITPMFMYGADGNTPELRPFEFKGMMRFWWRAIRAEDNIEKLRKEEAEMFGGTGEGEGKSKVQMILKEQIGNDGVFKYQPLPHHSKNNCKFCESRCRKSFVLSAIKPDTSFRIEFTFPEELKNILESLIFITFTLGGFGKRSRRGFGSIEYDGMQEVVKRDELLNGILTSLNQINPKYELKYGKIKIKTTIISNYPFIREILLGKDFSSFDEILKVIGEASHKWCDPSLGNASPRMASPVYVSVLRADKFYRPIITILNSAFPSVYPRWDYEKQKKFIKELL